MHLIGILIGNVGGTWWLNKTTVEGGDAKQPGIPKIWGQDARYVAMAAGAAGALMVGGPIGAALFGLGLAGYNSMDATSRWTKSFNAFLAAQQGRTGEEGVKALADRSGLLKELERGMMDMLGAGDLDSGLGVGDYAPGPMPGIC
jgi:hypothetical protein